MTLAEVETVTIPRACLETVYLHLREVGRQGYEGLGLLVGRQDGKRFNVLEGVVPAQKHIRNSDGVCVITEAAELHRLNVWLYRQKFTLIAQIHSHPTDAYHSSTDDAYAIATTIGSFSLVIPEFARGPFSLERAATYRLNARAQWKEVSIADTKRFLQIGP
jgi:hypothetical protein